MIIEFLSLLCLGLCLGHEDEKKNEKLPKPFLIALHRTVVERSTNVTLKCQSPFQNVTFLLGKSQDPRYKQEQIATGNETKFLLTDLEPRDAGTYFCSYKTTASHEWSEKSEHLQLMVTDNHTGHGASSIKTDTSVIAVTTFSCLSIFLLFLSVLFIYRCTRHGSSHEEPTKRTSNSEFPVQEATDLSKLERISILTEDPQGVTYAELNTKTPSEAASVPTEDPLGSCEYATLKV
ncbi:V-set and transmembrane domain-containing protein 1 [Diceros bicornis minor]|nr:V-set and transmembrane domain-containing protein 1 [Diceros bicornis minor]